MSNGSNQRTLFQTWGAAVPQNQCGQPKKRGDKAAGRRRTTPGDTAQVATYPDFPGFDSSSARVWIYPTNYPIREYQLRISEAGLFQNTLVCLPTGLGKTFIAAVVMYNFYRWYPSGKIVFMAPTKPLVAQQIEACYKVMGIPQAHMAELTGSTAAKQRQEVWRSKRVFFLTPQVKCVVIDEAHKALGNHAYCQVIRQLGTQTLQFRILALSATPGGDSKSVQSVISNLLISHIELRSEESPDIQAHSHQRIVEKMVVPLGEALSAHQARYLQVLEKFMSRLVQNRVMAHRDLRTLTKYQLILARDQFRKNPPPNVKGPQQGMLEGDFALCISLYHGYELLMQMGLRSLFFYIQGIMDGSREMSRARNELQRTPTFIDLYHEMEAMFVKPSAGPDESFIYSHPKLEKLEGVVLQHFILSAESSTDNDESTRVMIFSSFRESVQEIADMLNRHAPMIRVMTFMGQASAGKGVKGFTQKEQLGGRVVHRFRQGGFNTLVSTCVGEEGLDIGEVDLIVCFDAQKSPIRLVQRMGRTGRKRQGRIVVILAEGREERTYNQSQSNKRSVYKSITGNTCGFHMYPNSPRMLPEGVNPTLHKMHITCGQFDHRESGRGSVGGRRSHSERRTSLTHPQNLSKGQGRSIQDGFLCSTEYSLWASTMRLEENEAHPTLKQSNFMSIESDLPPQVFFFLSFCHFFSWRVLSLWEWRHWQHKVLPTHIVDHSLRCHHFTTVMALIDGMREENEVRRGPASLCKASLVSTSAVTKKRLEHHTEASYDFTDPPGPEAICPLPSKNDCPEADMDDDCAIINEEPIDSDNNTQQRRALDEDDVELQAMFYLPKWDSAPPPSYAKPLPERYESLKFILANVAELLSRSPPSPPACLEPFQVSFTLDVDDDDNEEMMSDADGQQPVRTAADSPTWDEVFGDEEVNDDRHTGEDSKETDAEMYRNFKSELIAEEAGRDKETENENTSEVKGGWLPGGVKNNRASQSISLMDDSMDLFGDDEAFLQMTIPDISTPGITPRTSPCAGDISISTEQIYDTSQMYNSTRPTEHTADTVQTDELACTKHLSRSLHAEQITEGAAACNTTKTYTHTTAPSDPAGFIAAPPKPPTESFESSHDYFPVNFDLGYSLVDSEDDAGTEAPSPPCMLTSPRPKKQSADTLVSLPTVSNSSTPHNSFTTQRRPAQRSESKLSTPQMLPEQRNREMSPLLTLTSKDGALPSPITSAGARRTLMPGLNFRGDIHCQSYEHLQLSAGFDISHRSFCQSAGHQNGRQFLQEEAELSEDTRGADISSDEEDGEEQNQSLDGFVVDSTQFSQGLNDSEMHGVYLKSVKSPAVHGKFKMSYRHHLDNVFSQVPEMDETYAEDSFVVGSEVEEVESGEDEAEDIELMPEDSYMDGRRQYATRRRVFLHKVRERVGFGTKTVAGAASEQGTEVKTKRTRIIRINDSSDEETGEVDKERSVIARGGRLENQHLLSDELDFEEGSPAPPGSVCILADSRCISTGVELMTSLRQRHAATVHVCSLDGSYFVVSNRMAVERHSQSDLAAMQNRKRLVERVTGLQRLFERVCLIVEKERTKPGEAARPFQRTRYYDSTLTGLVRSGVRLLWSDGAEQSAAVLADLARLEQRKGQGIGVPLKVKGQHRQQALQLYLNLPSVSYVHALNMSHNFSSIAQLMNSSVEAIQKGGCMSPSRAEEIYRFLRYPCDTFLMST
uniref:ATP-dependent RNA helicase FANCM n=1 Tax=Scophthalmus maximus TaxID=52904 RepID=A0A8D3BDK8_SCOMX